ncbi:hypothetical protein [Fischerella sp. PCC 9605]|uniref:hypothetical protein n=1 Tax=Fischerella sp. PCC 9605 TaxID=1173024 RepID=UPI000479B47C
MRLSLHRQGDRVAELEAGADDYLTKPYDPCELLATLLQQLRSCTTTQPVRSIGRERGNW